MTDETVPVDTGAGGEAPVAPEAPVNTDNTRESLTTTETTTEFSIPDEYKEKGWTKAIKSQDDLWKNYDNAQELIGKKTVGVPDENTTPEQLAEFYSKTRPENAEAYTFPEGVTEDEKGLYSKAFFDNGISAKQADGILKDHFANMEQQKLQFFGADGFDAVMKDSFSGDTEAQAASKEMMMKHTSDADKDIIDTMTNDQAGVMYRYTNAMIKKFGASEGQSLNNEASSQNMTESQLKDSRSAIRAEIAALETKPHNASDKTDLLNKLSATYKGGK